MNKKRDRNIKYLLNKLNAQIPNGRFTKSSLEDYSDERLIKFVEEIKAYEVIDNKEFSFTCACGVTMKLSRKLLGTENEEVHKVKMVQNMWTNNGYPLIPMPYGGTFLHKTRYYVCHICGKKHYFRNITELTSRGERI